LSALCALWLAWASIEVPAFASELVTTTSQPRIGQQPHHDVDVAAESTQLARWNILVQAGTSMLAQANQSAQSALKLLQ